MESTLIFRGQPLQLPPANGEDTELPADTFFQAGDIVGAPGGQRGVVGPASGRAELAIILEEPAFGFDQMLLLGQGPREEFFRESGQQVVQEAMFAGVDSARVLA